MPSKLFGVQIHLPSPQADRPRLGKISPTTSTTELAVRRSSLPSMDHIKRPSLANLAKKHGSSDKKERSQSKDKKAPEPRSPLIPKPVTLGMYMESPPVYFMGHPSTSTGALISGRLQITPNTAEATLTSVTMALECTTTTKRPVSDRCRNCMTHVKDLYDWSFLSKPKTFKMENGMQELPFSHLVPGHLPCTSHGSINSIDYSLHVRAKSSDGQEMEFRRELIVHRSLYPSNDRSSTRVFPPTNLTMHVTLPSVVHPIGEFPVEFRMTGITTKREDTTVRWRLRKLTWRIEEHETAIAVPCAKHAHKVGGEGKGLEHQHERQIGWTELKNGWKTDFDDGNVEAEFKCAIDASQKPQCDMETPTGSKISHNLVLELVIAEEWSSNKKPQHATPTGAARVLRTQFNLNVTQRTGMGLSWDDEIPPNYEDVPASPPHYQGEHTMMEDVPPSPPHYQSERTTVEDYDGDDLHEDVEHLNLEG